MPAACSRQTLELIRGRFRGLPVTTSHRLVVFESLPIAEFVPKLETGNLIEKHRGTVT
jgi:hypothetical protein